VKFWDSSAILPLLVEEASTPSALGYYENNPEIVAWWGTPVECASALARLEREAKLDSTAITLALGQLTALQAVWHEVQPLDSVRQIAQRLLRLHPLRRRFTATGSSAACLRASTERLAIRMPGCALESGGRARRLYGYSKFCGLNGGKWHGTTPRSFQSRRLAVTSA
jgi:predicted nucleic acid-binding protein